MVADTVFSFYCNKNSFFANVIFYFTINCYITVVTITLDGFVADQMWYDLESAQYQ